MTKRNSWFPLHIIGPGILVAATGVGAGDLVTAAFTGNKLGAAIFLAVLAGAGLKFVLNEGLARWQLVTGETLIEGCANRFGRLPQWLFMLYLVAWSFFVGAALMGACGVTANAVTGLFNGYTGKIVFGLLHSVIGVVLVRFGGYEFFKQVMKYCIGVMFLIVIVTGILLLIQDWGGIVGGLFTPRSSPFRGEGLRWTVALMGGVGGTVTLLSYGYWMREERRNSVTELRARRIDLAVGYLMTALFGVSMVIIGSTIHIEGDGTGLIIALANQLEDRLGHVGRWAFLLGAWGTVTCSLLGVWQSVPYLFADLWSLLRQESDQGARAAVDVKAKPYRNYLYALAVIPAAGLCWNFAAIQQYYAIVGAAFMPLLALTLLILNGRRSMDVRYRNSVVTNLLLIAVLIFFIVAGWFDVRDHLFGS